MRWRNALVIGVGATLLSGTAAQAATELSTTSRLQDRREVAAGQRSYVEGFQDAGGELDAQAGKAQEYLGVGVFAKAGLDRLREVLACRLAASGRLVAAAAQQVADRGRQRVRRESLQPRRS